MDLRDYLNELEALGHVARVQRSVSRLHELPNVQWQIEKKTGKAVIFENVDDRNRRVCGNLFLVPLRTGVTPIIPMMPELAALLAGMRKPGIVYPLWTGNEMYLGLYREIEKAVLHSLNNPLPPIIRQGNWDISITGERVDVLEHIPVPWYFKEDAGCYFTAAVTVMKDPESDYVNAGIYRIQVLDHNRLAVMINRKRDARSLISSAGRLGKKIQVAIAVGLSPEMLVAATMSVPFGRSEYDIAGGLARSPYGIANGITVNFQVPAEAEYLIEGYIEPSVRVKEGPFTEYDLIASQVTDSYCVNVTGIHYKENPLFHSLVCTSLEMVSLIMPLGMTEMAKTRDFLKHISSNVKDIFMLPGVPGTGLVVAIYKESDAEPLSIVHGLFAFSARLKRIVIVDDDIDIYDPFDVQWAIDTRVVSTRDFAVVEATAEFTDSARVGAFSVKLGIDATKKAGHIHRFARSSLAGVESINIFEYLSHTEAVR
jgi:2,5-furandicarboxylate decarboxylase 1